MKKALKALTSAALLISSTVALAATQGTAGPTSTGTSDVSVTINDIVQISSIEDIAFGTYSGTGGLAGITQVCVYRNGTGLYTVTATGSGAGNAFSMTNGTNTIAYTPSFNDISGPVDLVSGVSANKANAHTTDPTCGGLSNATIGVVVAESALQASPSGVYSGTLTVVVAPR